MALHTIKKGLDLPIQGEPEQTIETAEAPSRVALVAADYVGMKPTMHVAAGDAVRRGQLLFEDKKTAGVRFTSPGSGKVVAIHRGQRRALQSVVVELDREERSGSGETVRFASDAGRHPAERSGKEVRELLLESGLWTAIRTRPFSKVADPATNPKSIFVNVMDSNPHAPDPGVVLAGREEDFQRGLTAVSKLTEGTTFVCAAPETTLPVSSSGSIQVEHFAGKHPKGTVGMHIHTLDPVDRAKLVWHLGYQDVIAIGKLFASGELDVSRVISLAGPGVQRPRLLRTRLGASVEDLTRGEVTGVDSRLISGSVLAGRKAAGEVLGFLGRYHQQISVLEEGRQREFLGWLTLGGDRFSTINAFLSRLMPSKKFAFTTSSQGSHRAIVPIGMYERIFPLDIAPSFLLRSISVGDIEYAEQLGCLELDEEDLALCSFVCPGKHDYGPMLRDVLTTIEKEG